jgi:hypothetical protein
MLVSHSNAQKVAFTGSISEGSLSMKNSDDLGHLYLNMLQDGR